MPEYTVADVSYNQDGEMEQFLLFWQGGEPDTRRATMENILLFDPEDDLPFDGGLQDFFDGESALRVNDDPRIVVGQSGDEYSYVLSLDDNAVETTPKQAERLLQGVYDALTDGDISGLKSLHEKIMKEQVRRHIVNALMQTFNKAHRIEAIPNGWLVDDFYLVDWKAKLYTDKNESEQGDYIREGGKAVEKDTTYEFVQLRSTLGKQFDCTDVVLNGEEYTLTEREMVFLAKVRWLLGRQDYHPDTAFWSFADRWAMVEDEKPDLDVFDI